MLQSRTIRSSRIITALSLPGVAVLLLAGIYLPYDGSLRSTFARYVGTPLFAVMVPLLVWQLVHPSLIRLDLEGFALDGGLKRNPPKVAWRDVDRFVLYSPTRYGGRLGMMVGYNLVPSAEPKTLAMQVARRIAGVDGSLGGNWEIEPKPLMELMENCRRTALALEVTTAAPRSG